MGTQIVGSTYGQYGRPISLFDGYLEAQESGSTSDFPNYMSNLVNKVFYNRFGRAQSTWRQWAGTMSVNDFKQVTAVGLGGFPRLMKVREGGEFFDAEISELPGPVTQVTKFGRLFSLTRETIINDDLNRLRSVPSRMAEAAASTLAQDLVNGVLEAAVNAYDGVAYFHATHNNLITDTFGETGIANAYTKLRLQTDADGYRINLKPGILVVPPQLEMAGLRALNSTMIPTPTSGFGNYNTVQNIAKLVVEPYLNDPLDWYLFADPNETDTPAFMVTFLMGQDAPTIMLKNPELTKIMGGAGFDPYTMVFDEIWWKIRWEYDVKPWEYRAAVKANAS